MATSLSSTRGSLNSGQTPFIIGRVKSIVLSPYVDNTKQPNPDYKSTQDIGKIKFEQLYSNVASTNGSENSFAYPMFTFITQYPVIGEIVVIFYGPSYGLNDNKYSQQLFYMFPYNIWNNVAHNTMPNLRELANFYSDFVNKPGYEGGIGQLPEFPKGYTYTDPGNVRNLTAFEGDSIIQGRYGQSIRFGSTVTRFKGFNSWSDTGNNGDPIIILRNGQGAPSNVVDKFAPTVEDINKDKTSIYLTSGQNIIIDDLVNFPLKSYGVDSTKAKASSIVNIFTVPVSTESTSAAEQDNFTFNKTT